MTDDPSWLRNCDMLARSLRSLERKVAIIRRSTNRLITTKDVLKERDTVKQTTSSINGVDVPAIQEEMQLVEGFVRQNPAYNTQGMKLMTEAQSALHAYQDVCDGFYQRCIQVEENSRGKGSRTRRPALRGALGEDGEEEEEEGDSAVAERQNLLPGGGGSAAAPTQKTMFEKDLHDEIMAERERETREIADNVKDIHEIFEHINAMVGEQGVQLEVVEGNLDTAHRATRNATEHLRRAQQYQRSSPRNKLLLILVLVMCVVVALFMLRS